MISMDPIKVSLTGTQQTALVTLYGKRWKAAGRIPFLPIGRPTRPCSAWTTTSTRCGGYSRAGVWLTQRYAPVKASGAQLDWSIGDPRELEKLVPGLVFDCEWWFADADQIKRYYSPLYWRLTQVSFRITPIRRLGRGLRYHFGSARTGDV